MEFLNRGISGQTVGELASQWDTDALALRPDAVSLLIGVNSTIRMMIGQEEDSTVGFQELYRSLLFRLREADAGTLLILVEPFLLEAGRVDRTWREHLRERQAALRELAGEFQALFVPAQRAFDVAAKRVGGSLKKFTVYLLTSFLGLVTFEDGDSSPPEYDSSSLDHSEAFFAACRFVLRAGRGFLASRFFRSLGSRLSSRLP